MPGYTNLLPDINLDEDENDVYAPENFARYLSAQREAAAPVVERAPTYTEHTYDAFGQDVDDDGYGRDALEYHQHSMTADHVGEEYMDAYDEKEAIERHYSRYATPEVEAGGPEERSFDGETVISSNDGRRPTVFARPVARRAKPAARVRIKRNDGDTDVDEVNEKEELGDVHFGPVPTVQLRRNRTRTRKNIKLTAGNLVIDSPVPSRLASFLPRKENSEFLTTRYTAVTCDVGLFDASCNCHTDLSPTSVARRV